MAKKRMVAKNFSVYNTYGFKARLMQRLAAVELQLKKYVELKKQLTKELRKFK